MTLCLDAAAGICQCGVSASGGGSDALTLLSQPCPGCWGQGHQSWVSRGELRWQTLEIQHPLPLSLGNQLHRWNKTWKACSLWSQNKHPEIFIIMLLLKVLNVLYLKWNSFVLTCFHMLAFTRLQNCLIWLSNVTVMNLLGNGAIECIHCATPLWNILLDLLDSWFYFF